MAEALTFEELENKIVPKTIPLEELEVKETVQIGSMPTPEPTPTKEGEPPATLSLTDLQALAPQVGSFGIATPFANISEDDEERDMKWYTNFFNSLYANTIPAFSSAMANLAGDHDKAKFIQQESQKLYDENSKSAYAGGIASSVLTTAAALGGAALAGPGSVAGGLILAGYLGYHALMGAGQTKGLLKDYEEESGKDFSALTETAVTIGGGVTFLVAEKMGAKWLMKGGLLKRETLQQIGKAWIKKDTKAVTGLILKNVPKSMMRGGVVEGGEESFEQVMGNFIQATYNPEARDLNDLIAGVPEAGVAGAIAGTILGGGITIAQTSAKKTMTEMAHDMLNQEEVARVTTSLKEVMPAESDESISGALTYVSARARAKGIQLHEYLAEEIPAGVNGEIALKNGSKLIVDALESPTVENLFQDVGAILRNDLSAEELTAAEELFKVKNGKWTKAKNKQFSDLFTNWLATGKTKNKQLSALFDKTQEWFIDFYKGSTTAKSDLTHSKKMGEFFDQLLIKDDAELYSDPAGQDRKANILAKWGKQMFNGFLDKVDIEARSHRMGWEFIGLTGKKRMSVASSFQREGQGVMANMFDATLEQGRNTRQTRKALNDLVLLYEDKAKWNALSVGERKSLQRI